MTCRRLSDCREVAYFTLALSVLGVIMQRVYTVQAQFLAQVQEQDQVQIQA